MRKPAETVAFAGVKPGMVVGELGPGRGYYTRILAKAVGPKGKVYAIITPAQAARPVSWMASMPWPPKIPTSRW